MEHKQPTIIKTYKGNEEISRRMFNHDKIAMQEQGYFPTSVNYIPGSWGCGSFLIALLLVAILVGIIVFIYMLIVKPAGYLSVTYELREQEKTCPMCAESVKYEAKICKHCGYELPPNPIFKNEVKNEVITQKTKNSNSFIKSTDFKNNKNSLIAIIIVGLAIILYSIQFFNKSTENKTTEKNNSTSIINDSRTFNKPWREPQGSEYLTLGRIMTKKNIRGCGEYYVKEIEDNEYVIACSADGTNWVYYVAYVNSKNIYRTSLDMEKKLKPPR